MNSEGSQLARAMMSIHEVEMQRAARCPDWYYSAYVEPRRVPHPRGRRMLCRLGSFLVRIGRRLQEYGTPPVLPQGTNAVRSS
jgi:hypothetical protein